MSLDSPAQTVERPVSPEPEFQVLGVSARRHAAVPALDFDVHVTEPTGRHVYLIALTAMIMIEPARRRYSEQSRERLVELFGPPERWATTTRSLVWHRADVVVQNFTGATTFTVPVPCTYDLEVAGARYFDAVPDGLVPLAFNFNGTIHYRGEDGALQMSLVPWSCSAEYRFPAVVWHDAMSEFYPNARWIAVHRDTLADLLADKARRAAPTMDDAVAALLREAHE
jgi:hypothetical protein